MERARVDSGLFVGMLARRDVDFTADQRLHFLLDALFVELHRPAHDAVIGHGDGRLVQLFGSGHHLRDFVAAVQQAVLRMTVQVDERLVLRQVLLHLRVFMVKLRAKGGVVRQISSCCRGSA